MWSRRSLKASQNSAWRLSRWPPSALKSQNDLHIRKQMFPKIAFQRYSQTPKKDELSKWSHNIQPRTLKGLAKPNLAPPKLTTPRTKRSEASEPAKDAYEHLKDCQRRQCCLHKNTSIDLHKSLALPCESPARSQAKQHFVGCNGHTMANQKHSCLMGHRGQANIIS